MRPERYIEQMLNDEGLSPQQRKTLVRYIEVCQANGLKAATKATYAKAIRDLGISVKKPFEEITREDMVKYLVDLSTRMKESTLGHRKIIIKMFYKHLNDGDIPDVVKWFTWTRRNKLPIKSIDQLISPEEVLELIKVCDHPRDKALIAFLYESAARAGELLALKVGSVQFDENGAVVLLTGKTGERRIRLIQSAPYLCSWLNVHPNKGNPDAPLWAALRKRKKEGKIEMVVTGIEQTRLTHLIRMASDKAGIRYRHPHLFRHSRLTELAKYLPEYKLKVFAGWSPDSNVASIYVHLSGKDLDGDIIDIYGKNKEPKSTKKQPMKPKTCPRCERENPADARFCNCGQVLDIEMAMDLEDATNNLLMKLLTNPEIQKLLGAEKTDDGRLVIKI